MTQLLKIEDGPRLIDGELINAMIDAIESSGIDTINIVNANGISGSAVYVGTNASITLSLGAITPTTIVASGAISGSNLSGTNTGDQTIILTGDVTGSGNGSFTTTITAGAVSLGKMANLAANSIIGNNTGIAATPIALTATQTKTLLSLENVENTALSTWAGSANITTLGTIATGTWGGTIIAVNKGGTGQSSYTDGQLLIGNSSGNGLTKATLTQGSGVTITNGNGTITIAATGSGGTVTSVSGTANRITSTGGTTPIIDISASYVGQASITMLGTIGTGIWNAGAITSSGNIAYIGQAGGNVQTLADASTIAWDMNLGGIATVTPSTNRTMGAPTNIKAGGTYALRVISGGFTITWNAAFKWPGGVAPVSTGGTDIYSFYSFDGTTLDGGALLSFS